MQSVQLENNNKAMFYEQNPVTTGKRPWFGSLPDHLTEDFSFASVKLLIPS
ncbi:hypothetical protein [Paenibacillus alkalitolerans]|uniref:hypothetical protein n=1 Tax=Paenibacillus alkalitolerans TaxID=2799335 RepID=UPI0018F4068F|nr:hypothetical protein [Paenibacillus alkalitolerans]